MCRDPPQKGKVAHRTAHETNARAAENGVVLGTVPQDHPLHLLVAVERTRRKTRCRIPPPRTRRTQAVEVQRLRRSGQKTARCPIDSFLANTAKVLAAFFGHHAPGCRANFLLLLLLLLIRIPGKRLAPAPQNALHLPQRARPLASLLLPWHAPWHKRLGGQTSSVSETRHAQARTARDTPARTPLNPKARVTQGSLSPPAIASLAALTRPLLLAPAATVS